MTEEVELRNVNLCLRFRQTWLSEKSRYRGFKGSISNVNGISPIATVPEGSPPLELVQVPIQSIDCVCISGVNIWHTNAEYQRLVSHTQFGHENDNVVFGCFKQKQGASNHLDVDTFYKYVKRYV